MAGGDWVEPSIESNGFLLLNESRYNCMMMLIGCEVCLCLVECVVGNKWEKVLIKPSILDVD